MVPQVDQGFFCISCLGTLVCLWLARELLTWAQQGQLGSWASLSMCTVGLCVASALDLKVHQQLYYLGTLCFLSPTPNVLNEELWSGTRQSVFYVSLGDSDAKTGDSLPLSSIKALSPFSLPLLPFPAALSKLGYLLCLTASCLCQCKAGVFLTAHGTFIDLSYFSQTHWYRGGWDMVLECPQFI